MRFLKIIIAVAIIYLVWTNFGKIIAIGNAAINRAYSTLVPNKK